MNFEDRLLHAFIVVFYVCFFLATLVCVIATPLQLAHPQEVVTLFFVGMIGMVLVSPAILIVGIFLTFLDSCISSLVRAYCDRRRTHASCENRAPDRVVWKLDETKGGVK
jgi:hypothetical protein